MNEKLERVIKFLYEAETYYLGHRMGILGCSTAEMKMGLNQ